MSGRSGFQINLHAFNQNLDISNLKIPYRGTSKDNSPKTVPCLECTWDNSSIRVSPICWAVQAIEASRFWKIIHFHSYSKTELFLAGAFFHVLFSFAYLAHAKLSMKIFNPSSNNPSIISRVFRASTILVCIEMATVTITVKHDRPE